MSVPKFFEFFGVLLEALKDGEIHSAQEVKGTIAGAMNLTADDRKTRHKPLAFAMGI